jgi:S-(hydroxymethyl)glutathione dehydrogenase/alcohol dehydrogenase
MKLGKLDPALELGASHSVNSAREDAVQSVRDLTEGDGVDAAFEVLGRPETFEQAVAMVRDGGRMVAVGIAPGKAAASVEITRLVRRSLRIFGSYGARTRSDMPAILKLAARGFVRPERMVTRRYSLEQAEEAYQALNRGEIVGRAIVTP